MHTVYTARPRPSHVLPENPKPTPTMTMAEYAARENRAARIPLNSYGMGDGARRDLAQAIFEYVRDNPRAYTSHIVNDLGKPARTVYNAISAARAIAAEHGYIWRSGDKQNGRHNSMRFYWLEAAE